MAADRSKGWVLEANGVTTPLSRHGKVSSPPRRKLIPNPSQSLFLSYSLNFDQQLRVSSSFIPGDCTFVPSRAGPPFPLTPCAFLFLPSLRSDRCRSFLHGEAILFDGRTHDGKSGTSSLVPANAKACVSHRRRVEFARAASRIFTSRRSLFPFVRSLIFSFSMLIFFLWSDYGRRDICFARFWAGGTELGAQVAALRLFEFL